jgi:hypothetical protein
MQSHEHFHHSILKIKLTYLHPAVRESHEILAGGQLFVSFGQISTVNTFATHLHFPASSFENKVTLLKQIRQH